MFKVIEGNAVDALLNGDVDYLMHCCNTHANMGAGIAKEIATRIPNALEEDKLCHEKMNEEYSDYKTARMKQAGMCSVSKEGVINLYGQVDYGRSKRQVNYGYLATSIVTSILYLIINKNKTNFTVAAPYKMASDLAGGDWNVVREIVEGIMFSISKDYSIKFVWYKL